MQESNLRVFAVVGTPSRKAATRVILQHLADALSQAGCLVDLFDPLNEPLDLFNPDSVHGSAPYERLKQRVQAADVFVFGTPDYHGSMSGTLKNFLDHFWQEFAGKLFASIVASAEKGLTVTDQVRTVARQCYAWALPYGVSFSDREDLRDGIVTGEALKQRLHMMVHDLCHYGLLLRDQRQRDLEGHEPGFMARHRTQSPAAVTPAASEKPGAVSPHVVKSVVETTS